MSANRYAASVDINQAAIVQALRHVGAIVWIIKLPFDLLVGYNRELWLMECKQPNGKLSEGQERGLAECSKLGLRASVVRSPEEALALIGCETRGVEIGPRKFSSPWLDGTGDNG